MFRTKQLFLDVLLVGGLFFVYALVASNVLPDGVNAFFTGSLWRVALVMVLMVLSAFAVYAYSQRPRSILPLSGRLEAFSSSDLLLVLLPMTPIVQYVITNQDILSMPDALMVFGTFLLLAVLVAFVIPAFLSKFASRTVAMFVGLSFIFVAYSMPALALDFHWHLVGDFMVQFGILAAVLALLFVTYAMSRPLLYVGVMVFFILNVSVSLQGLAKGPGERDGSTSKLYGQAEGKVPTETPDIYLLVYDSYVGNETMLAYDIDNSSQEEYLLNNGFHIYEGTYSLGSSSISSMSRVLDVTNELGEKGRLPAAGNGAVQSILKEHGYRTLGVFPSDHFLQGVGSYYDEVFPIQIAQEGSSFTLLAKAIAEGEFRFDAAFRSEHYDDYVAAKAEILHQQSTQPRFIYTHDLFPGHSQNSGHCRDDEIEVFVRKLEVANRFMKRDVETVQARNPDAIVIIAGDHGPALTGDCYKMANYEADKINRLHMQERHGTFLAIRWPAAADVAHTEIRVLQDVFPLIFSHLYDDASLLNTKVDPVTDGEWTGGVRVRNGIIEGGADDGAPLFRSVGVRKPQ